MRDGIRFEGEDAKKSCTNHRVAASVVSAAILREYFPIRMRRLLLALVLVCFAPISLFSAELSPSLREALAVAAPGVEIPVIVTFAAQPDLRPFQAQVKTQRRTGVAKALGGNAEESQKEVRALLHGRGKRYDSLWIVNGLALAATPELISSLAARPEVAAIELDEVIELPEVIPSQTGPVEWNIAAVNAPALWELGFTGQEVTVAILDSGVDINHPDLGTRWLGGPAGWFDPYLGTVLPYDPDGHGTMVTGVAVGGSAGGTGIGVAPGARWVAAKIFRDDGVAVNSQILASFQWVLDPDGNLATADAVADVVNNSWGFEDLPGTCDSTFRTAVQNLKAAGIAVVYSGGNRGPNVNTSVSPANYTESFAVGAVDQNSLLANFSSRGPSTCDNSVYPEVVAPGVNIRTSDLTSGGVILNSYLTVAGTSFSAPHVSGVMALLLSAFPGLTPVQLEDLLKTSTDELGPAGADNGYGFGLVNALAAYNLAIGVPHLSVLDPAPPANDLLLDFGHVTPGQAVSRTVTLSNTASGLLQITAIGVAAAPFTVITDACTGQSLGAGESCAITLRFAPVDFGPASAGLDLLTSDADQGTVVLQLRGTGNTLPPPAQLVSPANGATGVGTTVLLQWRQLPDSDGDTIQNFVFLSTREDFSDTSPQLVASRQSRSVALAGAGGLFALGLAAGFGRRRQWLPAILMLAATLALLAACNGGGSSDDGPPPGIPVSEEVTGLVPGTTYFWKVVSQDSRGGAVQGEVRRFTTSPN